MLYKKQIDRALTIIILSTYLCVLVLGLTIRAIKQDRKEKVRFRPVVSYYGGNVIGHKVVEEISSKGGRLGEVMRKSK